MYRITHKFRTLVALLILLSTAGVVHADKGPAPQHSASAWQVSYWNNISLSGDPAFTGTESAIRWDWGPGSPHSSIASDYFSARWSRYLDLAAGAYRFTVTSDDGIRVYVDNQLILDQWNDHAARTFLADVNLSAGHHQVVVEYYERWGEAVAEVTWTEAPVASHLWHAEYFDNRWLSGWPSFERDEANIDIDYNWGYGAPAGLPSDNFSVRWSRTIHFEPGTYRFATTSDDGVRLWVQDHLLIDQWHQQAATTYTNNIYLAGDVPVKLEYYEHAGLASAHLVWSQIRDYPPPPDPLPRGTILVDDKDMGFVRGGSSRAWRSANEGQLGQLTWTWNNDEVRANYNWGRWYPDLAGQQYEVFVYIPERYSTTQNARYWVSHRGGYSLRQVDQSANSGRWVSLGTYWFRGDNRDYVSLSDVTFEPYVSRLIAFDAVRWEPR